MEINELIDIPQFTVIEAEKLNNEIFLAGELKNTDKHCPHCGKEVLKPHQYKPRVVRHTPIVDKPTYLKFKESSFLCPICNKSFTEKVEFVDLYQHSTKDYQRHVYELAKKQDFCRVAEMEGIDPGTVSSFFKTGSKLLKTKN